MNELIILFLPSQIRYRSNGPLVLHGITCTFEAGHKIDIVGRTGSGKSTLISALFRLVEPAGGKIIVDGIDISSIGLHDLRSRFGIIPKDPTLFNGTLRYNLDPLSQHTDQKIWEVNYTTIFLSFVLERPMLILLVIFSIMLGVGIKPSNSLSLRSLTPLQSIYLYCSSIMWSNS